MTFKSLTLTPFCLEKSSVRKMDILIFKRCSKCSFGWNQVEYARITITHVCFIVLTLAWSLRRCLNTQPHSLVFKRLPQDPANVNVRKNMCDPYNFIYLCLLYYNLTDLKKLIAISAIIQNKFQR